MTFDLRSADCVRRLKSSALVLAITATGMTSASFARADQATAEALFRDGKTLMGQNQFDQACAKFGESEKQDPQLGTLLALADCYSKAGKTASEWAAYNQVAFEAKKKGDSARAEAAAAKAASLEPTLSSLTINVGDTGTPGLQIRRDGEDVGKGALGTPIPVDPGSHVIEATALGYEVWQTTVSVGANRDLKTVLIPALQKKPEGADGGGAAAANPTRRTIGFVVGGVGVAGLVLGGVMGGLALSDKSSANKLCGADKTCDAAGRAKVDSANTKALVSTIGFGVGIAGVGAGIALILTSRGSRPAADDAPPPAAPAAALIPSVGPTGGGLSFVGRF